MLLKKSHKIISLEINAVNYHSTIKRIIDLSQSNTSDYICLANVHMSIEAHWEPKFAEVVNNAKLVTPDGMPLVKAMRLLYGVKQERVAGMDLLPDLLKEAEKQDLSVFFYGGTKEMLDRTKEYVTTHYPLLEKHQYFSPPFRTLTEEEEHDVMTKINDSGTNLVFVALGCPKQEKWMASMKGKINACMIGIGGALPVMVGMQKRAPKWMQQLSLEWLFRLYQEPQRLFKRYAITNSLFLLLLIKQWYFLKFGNKKSSF
jgi:N-acetylglucosaminyldiphosphoundecaprenol N-acetyl-beta-D-mannosaminyltransferase